MPYLYKKLTFIATTLFVFFVTQLQATILTNASVSVADITAGATTTYTITFDVQTQLDASGLVADQFLILTTADGPNFDNSVLQSLSGGTLTGSITLNNQTQTTITVTSGVATNGQTTTFVLSGVVNPGSAGIGPNYTIRTADFSDLSNIIIDEAIFSGSTYIPSNFPAVSTPITDKIIIQEGGTQVVASDLNSNFVDGDGDALTFTVDAGNDVNIAIASITGNQLTVVPIGSGVTNITIRGSDLPSGTGEGEVTATFQVTVIGEFSNASVTPSVLDSGATTTYSLTFSPASTITNNQVLILNNSAAGGADYSSATLGSVSGSTLNISINSQTATGINFNINSGTANSSQTVSIQINGVTNPGIAGIGPEYIIRLFDLGLSRDVDQMTLIGTNFTAVGIPTIVSPIANQLLDQVDGASIVVADLNTVFNDGDGDNLTFTVETGNDTNIATATINDKQLIVTPVGPGITTLMIKASDLPSGTGEGEIIDSFFVQVIGALENASITPGTFRTSASTTYSIEFSPASTITGGQLVFITTNDITGPDFSSTNLGFFNGGSLTVNGIFTQSSQRIVFKINSGTADSSQLVNILLDGVINPSIDGQAPNYKISIYEASVSLIDEIEFPGNIYLTMNDIFMDGFEDIIVMMQALAKLNISVIPSSSDNTNKPIFDSQLQSYRFKNEYLPMLNSDGKMYSLSEVILWHESILIHQSPNDDWNNNGESNINEVNPFGIEDYQSKSQSF